MGCIARGEGKQFISSILNCGVGLEIGLSIKSDQPADRTHTTDSTHHSCGSFNGVERLVDTEAIVEITRAEIQAITEAKQGIDVIGVVGQARNAQAGGHAGGNTGGIQAPAAAVIGLEEQPIADDGE